MIQIEEGITVEELTKLLEQADKNSVIHITSAREMFIIPLLKIAVGDTQVETLAKFCGDKCLEWTYEPNNSYYRCKQFDKIIGHYGEDLYRCKQCLQRYGRGE